MTFDEIKAGLDKYMAEIDAEKRNAATALAVKYIVKEHSKILNDGNDLFYVYAHYPTTEPDVMVMPFVSKVNAELFCEALNAENEHRDADLNSEKYAIVPSNVDKDCFWQAQEGDCCCGNHVTRDNNIYCNRCGRKLLWKGNKMW